jgi:hypothetical protein
MARGTSSKHVTASDDHKLVLAAAAGTWRLDCVELGCAVTLPVRL